MTRGVESIESDAEKILQEARTKAGEILREANEEAGRILAEKPNFGEVEAECKRIVSRAAQQADREVKEAETKATQIRASAQGPSGKKTDEIVQRVLNQVRGAS
jgi:vacuolar-type H+-ATPase subunit H